jgi:Glutaredoxin-like domain (DUF836)
MLATMAAPLPDLILYGRGGCHLCDETRTLLRAILAERAAQGQLVPPMVERDITAEPDWERSYRDTIPVVELKGRRLELATSPARLRALLRDTLDRDNPDARAGVAR